MTNHELKEVRQRLEGVEEWQRKIGYWYRAKDVSYEPIKQALRGILSLRSTDRWEEVRGTAFIIDNQGTVLTANHIYEDRVKEWGQIRNAPVTINDKVVFPEFELVRRDEKNDYALLRSERLIGIEPLRISNLPEVQKGKPYFLLGYPDTLRGNYEEFPYVDEPVVTIGERLDRQSTYCEENGIERQFLRAAIWPGFSGGPVLDKDGCVCAMAVSGTISRTADDYADILPLRVVDCS